MTLSKIVIYADGGDGIGTGHIFRMYPIFRSLCALGVHAEMWVPLEDELLSQLNLEGVQEVPVDSPFLVNVMSESETTVVVLDTYRHRQELYKAFDELGCRLAIFDDHFCVDRKVKMIVNSSPNVNVDSYDSGLASEFLLGPSYTSVSNCFVEARANYEVSPKVSCILIALGGMDTQGNLPALIEAVLPLLQTPTEICVLSKHPLKVDVPEHVKLNQAWLDQDNLAQCMLESDLAILAGGSMLWQTACIGLPTLSWPQTQGQKSHVAAWENKGTIIAIKELNELQDAMTKMQSLNLRLQLSDAGRNLVDGKGANHIASHLISMLEE